MAPDWTLCRDQRLPWFEQRGERDLWRLSVPQTAPVLELPEPPLVEWHGGLRWVRAAAADAAALAPRRARAGGHATLFGGPGSRRPERAASPASRLWPRRWTASIANSSAQFDPAGIFNRGRLYPDF